MAENAAREGLVSIYVDGIASADVVTRLDEGIRTHLRKADHYSGNILDPLGVDGCVRVQCVTTTAFMRWHSFWQ